jgi:hypothetical protein
VGQHSRAVDRGERVDARAGGARTREDWQRVALHRTHMGYRRGPRDYAMHPLTEAEARMLAAAVRMGVPAHMWTALDQGPA